MLAYRGTVTTGKNFLEDAISMTSLILGAGNQIVVDEGFCTNCQSVSNLAFVFNNINKTSADVIGATDFCSECISPELVNVSIPIYIDETLMVAPVMSEEQVVLVEKILKNVPINKVSVRTLDSSFLTVNQYCCQNLPVAGVEHVSCVKRTATNCI